ncbi:GDP-mannose 4,6 dehydratase domain-containing protein [Ditylenchus destructor]|nr:GDP-mannose 4,6 dehydratase domain-containing protein [Ditylenchus destructor]
MRPESPWYKTFCLERFCRPITLFALCSLGSILLIIAVYNSRLIPMVGDRVANVGQLIAESDEVASLKKEIADLQQQLLRLKHTVDTERVPKKESTSFSSVKFRNEESRKRILVTGGAGFVGSHLVDRLMTDGHEVIALDNFFTGRRRNVEQWIGHPNFEMVHHDIVNPYHIEVDQIYHLASPASPPHYMYNPVKTLKTNTIGTINLLGLARRVKARFLLASTSEVYGDPEVNPQPETYWGRVNTIGPRACYDEGKRVAESLLVSYNKQENVDIRIARIFNTFGPRMHMNDGRVVSNFIIQCLKGEPITIYGDGNQTRSFQYVSDLVEGLITLMNSNVSIPVNLGNPEEHPIRNFAEIIKNLVGSKSEIRNLPKVQDDPQQRRPDIKRAGDLLGWKPKVLMNDGLKLTVEYFRQELEYEKQRSSDEEKRSSKSR